jgi:hypothetical protein
MCLICWVLGVIDGKELLFESVVKVTCAIANQNAWFFSSNIFSFLEERINLHKWMLEKHDKQEYIAL